MDVYLELTSIHFDRQLKHLLLPDDPNIDSLKVSLSLHLKKKFKSEEYIEKRLKIYQSSQDIRVVEFDLYPSVSADAMDESEE